MEIAKRIMELEEELKELKKQKETEKQEARDKFVLKGKLTVTKRSHDPFYGLPEEFRRICISIEYTNTEEAREVGLYPTPGGMTYYYFEGWIVSLGGGKMILVTPRKATEEEWKSVVAGNVPRKFLRDWVKKIIKE